MKLNENTEHEEFSITEINIYEMFYFIEKAYESCERWAIRGQDPKENPLFKLLKMYANDCTIPLHGSLDETVCQFVTDVS